MFIDIVYVTKKIIFGMAIVSKNVLSSLMQKYEFN